MERAAARRIEVSAWWTRYGAITLACIYAAAFATLLCLKHDAFNTRTYDFARFDQAIWNTLHGRPFFSTILYQSILGNHFSPFLALFAPLFMIWDDARMLLLAQAVAVAAAGFVLSRIVRLKHPALAPWFLLAFFLNPALHEVTLFEFRRIVPAMPFLALAMYALYTRKRPLMALGLGLALLCKEDIGFVVFMVGFFLLVFQRDWRWGLPTMLVGGAWVIVVSLWVIPAFAPATGDAVYPQLYYFDFLGDSYQDIVGTVWRDPSTLLGNLFGPERLLSVGRLLLPMGVVLPFLAPGWALICLPSLAYLLAGDEPKMYRLEQWYTAPILPVLFAAVAVGLVRIPKQWAHWLTAGLVLCAAAGFLAFSPAPLGGDYESSLYRVTTHHRLAARIIHDIPAEASVAAQPLYVPHLSHREHVYHYPWIVIGQENVDLILLDRQSNPYPFTRDELNAEIDNLLADPLYAVEVEADGIYVFRRTDNRFAVGRVAGGSMSLTHAQVAVEDEHGLLRPAGRGPVHVRSGSRVCVSLYWQALAVPGAERTISVRAVDAEGRVIAQHDGWPGQGKKPTSWWEAGWTIRDVHDLAIPSDALPGPIHLETLVYDSYSGEIVAFDDGTQRVTLSDLVIVP